MGREHERHAARCLSRSINASRRLGYLGVDVGCWLVGEHDRRARCDRPDQPKALLVLLWRGAGTALHRLWGHRDHASAERSWLGADGLGERSCGGGSCQPPLKRDEVVLASDADPFIVGERDRRAAPLAPLRD